MPKYAQIVTGPAGSGKSTYCSQVLAHCASVGRSVHVVNLDPAAERFDYAVSGDVRDLIAIEDVMTELDLGPNGALLYCMEYLEDHMDEWLEDVLSGFGEDDYVLFDCPGQVELYSHVSVFRSFVSQLRQWGWNMCAVYLVDSHFIQDAPKFISGCLAALSAMMLLELPHVSVLSKMDMLKDRRAQVDEFLQPDALLISNGLSSSLGGPYRRLNHLVASLLDRYSLVSFVPLDISEEDSLAELLQVIDGAIQYGEDAEVRASTELTI